MRRHPPRSILALALVAGGLANACTGGAPGVSPSRPPGDQAADSSRSPIDALPSPSARASTPPVPTPGEIRVAFFGALTGDAASRGLEQVAFARLAVEDFNARYAGKHHATLVERDTGWTPATISPAAEDVAADPTIIGIVGPHCSCQVENLAAISEKAGLPFVSASATDPSLSTRGYRTFFRVVPSGDIQGVTDGTYIAKTLALRKVLVASTAESWNEGLGDVVDRVLREHDVATKRTSLSSTDGTGALVKVAKSFSAELVFLASDDALQGVELARALTSAGRAIPVFGGDAFYSFDRDRPFIDAAGATEGSYASAFAGNVRSVREAAGLLERADLTIPGWQYFGPPSYVATEVVLEAAARAADAGHLDRPTVLSEVGRTKLSVSVLGMPIGFDSQGELIKARFYISQVVKGAFVQVAP